ncbi:hypothetical protein KEM48_001503 [Puccinia striiformis f. sp. tritici PST-130]|nr:hypothetical protein Pst134EB_001381 [Puccinia striiformis f. sp. tritici]KAI9607555.1 hypothetical protein KEM48_001503 [Puccinia striiformis f. sp. tritici PST-130]
MDDYETMCCCNSIISTMCSNIYPLENPQSLSSTRTTSKCHSPSETSPSSSSSGSSAQPDQDQKLILKDQIMRLVKELVILPERKDPENDYHSNSNSLFHSLKTKGIGE